MTTDEIRELIKLLTETGVAELEVQRGENRVRIRRAFPGEGQEIVVPPDAGAASVRSSNPSSSVPAPQHAAARASSPSVQPADMTGDPSLVIVKSPIVGTFYESPSPGAPPFVRIGDTVEPGEVLCIIESMKLMNEIEAEIAGSVVSKLVASGQPVEYGEALFAIRPL